MTSIIDASPIAGVRLAAAAAGLRYQGREDVALIELCEAAVVAGVFTRNRFKAAAVTVAQKHLSRCTPRYLLINAGIANAGVGAQGVADAQYCCAALAALVGVSSEAVLPFSTGVIGERLPTAKFEKAMPELLQTLCGDSPDAWEAVARAMMTTDTVPKVATRLCQGLSTPVKITGIAKGAGMICPNMGTMLAFIATDISLGVAEAQTLLAEACAISFNAITVDGDTSTNDACMLIATGRSGVTFSALSEQQRDAFKCTLSEVAQSLAQAIVRDAEGAKHFITIKVEGAANVRAARAVAMTVANSPLVKTALSVGDPNWGRILAAIGRSPIAVKPENVDFYFGDSNEVRVVEKGALAPTYTEAQGCAALRGHDVTIRIVLNSGTAAIRVWTSDLTADYVRINADYRS